MCAHDAAVSAFSQCAALDGLKARRNRVRESSGLGRPFRQSLQHVQTHLAESLAFHDGPVVVPPWENIGTEGAHGKADRWSGRICPGGSLCITLMGIDLDVV